MATSLFCLRHNKNPFQLPDQYEFLKVLGEGGFGKVVKCWDRKVQRNVAIKIPKFYEDGKEVSMLKKLMSFSLNKCNIVEFFGSFHTQFGRASVFELLDISIEQYVLKNSFAPMLLSDIRTIIQQVATAFDALKSIGVIHTDIKPDNIMLEDHQKRPFRVKLIDFGLAISSSKAKQGMCLQTSQFRSPEIILGLPFSEAIDMWSLGCVMASMISGYLPFPGDCDYKTLQFIVDLLGQPADHLLNDGKKTELYLKKTKSNRWRLKTPLEFGGNCTFGDNNYNFPSLEILKKLRLELNNKAEAEERHQCIELLKAMLKIDATERITPSGVLVHPFIASDQNSSHNEASESAAAHPSVKKDETSFKETTEKTVKGQNGGLGVTSTQSPSSLISGLPVASENTLETDSDLESDISLQTDMSKTSSSLTSYPSGEDFDCEPPATALKEDDVTNIQSDDHSPSPKVQPSHVFMVRTAASENSLQTDSDLGSDISLQTDMSKTSSSLTSYSSGEDFDCEPPATALKEDDVTNIQSDDHSPSPTVQPSHVFIVRTAASENTQISEDFTTCDNICTKKKNKKKKKNCFRRLFSWMRKTFFSCWTCVEKDDANEK